MHAGHREDARGVELPVAIGVVVASHVVHERVLHKEIIASGPIQAPCGPVNVVHEGREVDRHVVQALDFATYIDIAKFHQRAEASSKQLHRLSALFPDHPGVSFILRIHLGSHPDRDRALHELVARHMDVVLVGIASVHRDREIVGQLLDEEIPAIQPVVWIVARRPNLDDLLVQSCYLAGDLVDLVDGNADVVFQHRP